MKSILEGPGQRPSSQAGPRRLNRWAAMALLLVVSLGGGLLAPGATWAQNLTAAGLAPSLKRVPVPQPSNLDRFVKDKTAAIALGKALFWDMQVGSDAVQACASCHFHAGADNRFKNVVSPGLNGGDITFQAAPPNGTLDETKFPFTQFQDSANQSSPMIRSWNDVVSSPGVYDTTYVGQPLSGAVER